MTYAPSGQVQNLPKNQMDILLAGGAYGTLQYTDEQIWPSITKKKRVQKIPGKKEVQKELTIM